VVVVSQGNRPAELATALDSVRAQQGVEPDVVVVGNGWAPIGIGADVHVVELPENLGAPGGRNAGVAAAAGRVVLFLDDDAWLDQPDVLAAAVGLFAANPRLGAAQLRVCDPAGRTLRRWVPRARVGDPARPGPAFALAEGATVVRRAAFDGVGGFAAAFRHGHEGLDLAWRLWNAGWEVRYAAELIVRHPATAPQRHSEFYRLTARNRVWAARRNLPAALIPVYLGAWAAISSARLARRPAGLRQWWAGFGAGWRDDPGPRSPMRWRTVWRLTRLGQPPII
jgi:GT2 family glycosyltransferase